MTDDDVLKSRFDPPEPSKKKPPPDATHVEAGYIDMMDRLIDGGMVVDGADRVRMMKGESPPAAAGPDKPEETPAEEKDSDKKPRRAA